MEKRVRKFRVMGDACVGFWCWRRRCLSGGWFCRGAFGGCLCAPFRVLPGVQSNVRLLQGLAGDDTFCDPVGWAVCVWCVSMAHGDGCGRAQALLADDGGWAVETAAVLEGGGAFADASGTGFCACV